MVCFGDKLFAQHNTTQFAVYKYVLVCSKVILVCWFAQSYGIKMASLRQRYLVSRKTIITPLNCLIKCDNCWYLMPTLLLLSPVGESWPRVVSQPLHPSVRGSLARWSVHWQVCGRSLAYIMDSWVGVVYNGIIIKYFVIVPVAFYYPAYRIELRIQPLWFSIAVCWIKIAADWMFINTAVQLSAIGYDILTSLWARITLTYPLKFNFCVVGWYCGTYLFVEQYPCESCFFELNYEVSAEETHSV